jgi:hypothetical protein
MLALVAFFTIRTCTRRLLGNCDLVEIASCTSDIENLLLMAATLTEVSLSINQKHALCTNAVKAFKVGLWGLLAE